MSPEPSSASRPALQAVRDALPRLTPTMRRVAEAILADPLAAGSASITALARRADANPPTVSRFATRIGYSGFPELRSAIALENGRNVQSSWERDIGGEITQHDSPGDVLDILAGGAARALRDAAAGIDLERVQAAARTIATAERVHLYGEWGDSIALRELHLRLQRIGIAAWFHEGGSTALRALCNTLTGNDVVVVLNRSGEDAAAADLLRDVHTMGAATVAVHGAPGSPVDLTAGISIFTGIRNGEVWTHYYSGRASDTLVSSLLWVLVAQLRSADNSMRYFDAGVLGKRT